jgi:hypothetical protein
MRIQRHARSCERELQVSAELEAAARARGAPGRICGPHCTTVCRSCGSTACQCQCSPYCTEASLALSSDPQTHPIEPRITPLVFAMKRTGLFDACWSCEGHDGSDGRLSKTPGVWFYCDALTHVRLLAAGVGKLGQTGRLSTPWRVAVTFSDPDNPDPTFVLEPALAPGASARLADLQRDADEIARALGAMMSDEARAVMSLRRAP